MRYYRNDTPAVRAAWDTLRASKKQLHQAAAEFAAAFGGEAVVVRSLNEFKLHGFKFDPPKQTDIWTAKDADFGTQRPRSTPQRGCEPARRAEHKLLKADFYDRLPKASASINPLYTAIGTDWGAALFGGVGLFDLDGVTYIQAGVTLNDDCIEILGSEYEEAKARSKAKPTEQET